MTSNAPQKPNHLEPSPLGTKEYWDNLYTTEITNHSLDPTDEGTIWFDDSAAEDKVIQFLEEKIIGERLLGKGITRENCSFLDLGTGNGHFLGRLREGEEDDEEEGDEEGEGEGERERKGWGGRMLGVDYSEQSIEFAKRVVGDSVEFKWWDIMNSSPSGIVLEGPNKNGWDVVVDKGTFDAISLSEEKDQEGKRICEGYKERVVPLVREGGVFLVTSCNWTEEELRGWFDGGELVEVGKVGYRTFSFGGRKGQSVSSVCFRKRGVR